MMHIIRKMSLLVSVSVLDSLLGAVLSIPITFTHAVSLQVEQVKPSSHVWLHDSRRVELGYTLSHVL